MMQQELIRQRKEQINIFTEELMKQVEAFALQTQGQLGKLDQFVEGDDGKQLLDESNNEVQKMLYRIKDFNAVYNISENRFKSNPTGIPVKLNLDEVRQLIDQDLRNKNIDINIRLAEDIPGRIQGDENVFREVILNLLTQSISGCFRSVLTIQVEQKTEMNVQFLKIDVENFKSDIKKDEAAAIADMCDNWNFLDIIEAKVDVNVKIAKILCDENKWRISLTYSRGIKYTLMVPLDGEKLSQDQFDRMRGKIKDVDLPEAGQPMDAFTKV